mmetsp:Transcript_21270/g.50572  ORF Transcript_21270/g.50572 Transcript_21270/m.50572 type:complete len:405 (-) Transcript_21270:247-1461(-)
MPRISAGRGRARRHKEGVRFAQTGGKILHFGRRQGTFRRSRRQGRGGHGRVEQGHGRLQGGEPRQGQGNRAPVRRRAAGRRLRPLAQVRGGRGQGHRDAKVQPAVHQRPRSEAPGDARRIGRSYPLQLHRTEGGQGLPILQPRRQVHPLRRSRARHGGRLQRSLRLRRFAPLLRFLHDLHRVLHGQRPSLGPLAVRDHLHLHARFHRSWGGRPYPPADRAARADPRHAEHQPVASRRFRRDGGRLQERRGVPHHAQRHRLHPADRHRNVRLVRREGQQGRIHRHRVGGDPRADHRRHRIGDRTQRQGRRVPGGAGNSHGPRQHALPGALPEAVPGVPGERVARKHPDPLRGGVGGPRVASLQPRPDRHGELRSLRKRRRSLRALRLHPRERRQQGKIPRRVLQV